MNVQILHCSPPCTCTYAFSLHPLLPVRVYGYYFLIKMCQICFVNSYQSNNHRQRYKIKKLVQSYQKIQIKTPRRAFDRVCIFFLTTPERWEWIILAVWTVHFLYFYFVTNLWKKNYGVLTLAAGPPLPPYKPVRF